MLLAELDRQAPSALVVRRYRLEPSPLVRDVRRGWRSGRADLVLGGHFDLMAALAPDASERREA